MISARFTTLSPISHGSFGESAGNTTLCRRMSVVSLPGMPRIPCVSGNALRGVMRRYLMRGMLDAAKLDRTSMLPVQWDRLYAALANGGHLDGSETRVDPDRIRKLRRDIPPLSLFGSALYTWMLPGHLTVGILWPRCAETMEAGLVSPEGPGADLRAEDLVEELSHCRHIEREFQDPTQSGVTPMPTTIEAIATGAVLESQILFAPHASEVERGALAYALSDVKALGGKSGSGMGSVKIDTGDVDIDSMALAYTDWLESVGEQDGWFPLQEHLIDLAGDCAPKVKAKKKAVKA